MTNAPSLRLCTQADAAALSLIGAATFLETFADIIAGPDIVAHCQSQHGADIYAKWLSDDASRCWLAEPPETGAPVGYQVLTSPDLPIADPASGDIELKRIYMFSRYHGGGLASRMMEHAIDAARTMGKTRILLGVYAENARAIAFYEKMGFGLAGDRHFRVGSQDFYDKVMARPL